MERFLPKRVSCLCLLLRVTIFLVILFVFSVYCFWSATNATREFSDGHYSDSAQNEPSSQVSFASGSLEGDSVTTQGPLTR